MSSASTRTGASVWTLRWKCYSRCQLPVSHALAADYKGMGGHAVRPGKLARHIHCSGARASCWSRTLNGRTAVSFFLSHARTTHSVSAFGWFWAWRKKEGKREATQSWTHLPKTKGKELDESKDWRLRVFHHKVNDQPALDKD